MKRNILVSFAAHIVISIICFVPVMFFLLPRELLILTGFALLIVTGRLLLKPVEGKRNNFLSVWSLGIILLLIVVVCSVIGIYVNSFDINDRGWAITFDATDVVVLSNPVILPFRSSLFGYLIDELIDIFTRNGSDLSDYIILWISPFITSAALWIGLRLKMRSVRKLRQKQVYPGF